MTRERRSSVLEEILSVLLRGYGEPRLKKALIRLKLYPRAVQKKDRPPASGQAQGIRPQLDRLKTTDSAKHALLMPFYESLRKRTLLAKLDDLRIFASAVGMKELNGKSRSTMVSRLVEFLITKPNELLADQLKIADDVSEEKRREGYSLLTEKLLGDRRVAPTSPGGN